MMFHRFGFLLLSLLAFTSGMVRPAAAQSLTDETFFLTFVPNVQFSPVYAAIEKGYFAGAGLNITIEHADEPLGVDLIAADELQFGLVSGEQLLAARGQGRPVVFVYEWFQQYPVGIVTPVESGIDSVTDLAGRRVGIPGRFGASYSGLTALLSANAMAEADISLEEIGFNAPEVVCVGAVDAAVVYINNEPLQIRNRALADDCGSVTDVAVFPVSDAVDMVSNGIITNEQTLTEQPELVANVVAAFDAGLRAVIQNPAAAYLISLDYVEGLPITDELRAALETEAAAQDAWLYDNAAASRAEFAEQREMMMSRLSSQFTSDQLIQMEVLLASIELWDADRLGFSDASSWEATQSVLLSMGFLEAPLDDLNAAFTNQFVPTAGMG